MKKILSVATLLSVMTLGLAGCVYVDAAQDHTDSLGLKIMRERAAGAGAGLDIVSTPGQGTTVTVLWRAGEALPAKVT